MSEYRESANKRREERQSKPAIRPPSSSKRDTRKWCRGKVGIQHDAACVEYKEHKRIRTPGFAGWKLLVCKNCGKELDYWSPPRFPSMFIFRGPKPEWVCE